MPSNFFKTFFPVICIFLLGSGIAVGTFLFLSNQEEKQIHNKFLVDAEDRYSAIKAEAGQNTNILQALISFYYSSAHVDRKEFQIFANSILKDHPTIEALEWLGVVQDEERDTYEQRVKEEGFPDFEITEVTPDGGLRRAARRPQYYPVEFIEPFEHNKKLLGLDSGAVPMRAQAMQTAREKNQSVSTARIFLLQAQNPHIPFSEDEAIRSGRFGFLVFHPIFYAGDGRSQGKLAGFVAAVLNSKQTIVKAMSHIAPVGIDIYYYDISPDEKHRLIYYWPSPARTPKDAEKLILPENIKQLKGLYWMNQIEVIGRKRLLLFVPTSFYFQGKYTRLPGLLAASLFVITLLLSFYSYNQIRRTAIIEKLVKRRTEDLKEANEKLLIEVVERKKAQEAAQQAARVKSEFASTVSHELRTPLTVIKGGIDVLDDEVLGPVNNEQKDMLVSIKNHIDRLSRLINDVLDYQKFESGRMKFTLAEQDLNLILLDVLKDSAPTAGKRGVKLVSEIPSERLKVQCDKDKIIQVMFNLLSNALKFTGQGTVTVRLERAGEGWAKVSVKDSGPGIKEKDKAKLFQTFSQLETIETRQTGGTGLGLSICKKIIDGHAGTIGVESVYGQGATFYFTLKLKG